MTELLIVGAFGIALNIYNRHRAYKEGVIDTERAYKSKLRLIADSEMEAWAKLGDIQIISKKRADILNKIIDRKDRELNILRSERAYQNRKKVRKNRKKGRAIR